MKIQDIYQKYQVMPSLQLHMLRVASVATIICDNFSGPPIDKSCIISACLLHDMGNIIKFDLTKFPEFLQPQGLDYWQEVKEDYTQRYGDNEFVAVELIAEEIGVLTRVKELIQAVNFSLLKQNSSTRDFGKKICDYADMRVGPFGVVSLEERLNDFKNRYQNEIHTEQDHQQYALFGSYSKQMERQIFKYCDISPEEITNESLSDTIDSLRNFVVQTRP